MFGCYRTEIAGPSCVTTSRPLSYPHLSSVLGGPGQRDPCRWILSGLRLQNHPSLVLGFSPFVSVALFNGNTSPSSLDYVHLTFIESVNSCGYKSKSAFHDALSVFLRRVKAPEAKLRIRSFLMHAANLQEKFLGGTRNPRRYLYSVFKVHNCVMELRCVV